MSSPSSDKLLDDIFRDALQPMAQAEPPGDCWPRIVGALPSYPAHLPIAGDTGEAPRGLWRRWIDRVLPRKPVWQTTGWRVPRWHKVVSWVHAYETAYPPSTSSLVCLAPDGRCRPSSFASVMVKQVLDLRLSS
jgi:hypothetical protein